MVTSPRPPPPPLSRPTAEQLVKLRVSPVVSYQLSLLLLLIFIHRLLSSHHVMSSSSPSSSSPSSLINHHCLFISLDVFVFSPSAAGASSKPAGFQRHHVHAVVEVGRRHRPRAELQDHVQAGCWRRDPHGESLLTY